MYGLINAFSPRAATSLTYNAEKIPSGTAITSATSATMIEPTSNGMIPYQSCQKLAVIQFVPKRNDVIA